MDVTQIEVGIWKLLKLFIKALNNKILQYRLSTYETKVIRTNYGQCKGLKRKTVYDEQPYYSFEGIPFAQPPLGALRFRAPQPPDPWEGILDCTKCKAYPMQKSIIIHIPMGTEDCLYLNVYAKKLTPPPLLPVMVWLYGGGFQFGGASPDTYAPDYFMRKDIVLVTLNYRVGALGFLSLKDPSLDVPGNAGLKDQLMALRWVKENIAHFNGDPNNITLFGESAGAASVHFMMLTDKANGLFHKAILQSGTVLCPWVDSLQRNWAYRLAAKLGYKGSRNDRNVFRFLSKVVAAKLVKFSNLLQTKEETREHLLFPFGPVVEPYESKSSITTRPFIEMLKNAWSNNIPVIIGGTSFEGLFLYQKTKQLPYLINELRDCESAVPHEVRSSCNAMVLKQVGLQLKRAHFGNTELNFKRTFLPFLDMVSIKHFWHGLHRTVLARRAYATQAPTYVYRFDFDSAHFNQARTIQCDKRVRGAAHADEVSYLFYNLVSYRVPKASAEYKTIERLIEMWTAFAATSDPNCQLIQPCVWEPVRAGVPKCANIGKTVEFIDLPEREKLAVWDSFYTQVALY